VKNVGKDNNEKSKKKKKEKKNGRAKTVGGRQIRDETSGKDKKCWPKKKKKKKTIPTCIKFFFSLSCPEGGGYRDSGLPLQCFLPLLLISFFSLDLSSERRTFLASHKWEKEESSLA
jgi:hypothetical protein